METIRKGDTFSLRGTVLEEVKYANLKINIAGRELYVGEKWFGTNAFSYVEAPRPLDVQIGDQYVHKSFPSRTGTVVFVTHDEEVIMYFNSPASRPYALCVPRETFEQVYQKANG